MPCTDAGPTWEQQEQEQRFNTTMTRLSCDRCRELIKRNGSVPEWAKEWWEYHKAEDRERLKESAQARKENQVRSRAIAKLTNEEREELGV
jgi:hypothetical protein